MGSFWIDNMPGKPNTAPIVPSASSPQMPTGSELSNPPTIPRDFNLGGYQPQTPNPYENDFTPRNPDGSLATGPLVGPDPRVTTQPQPYQQGPAGTMLPPAIAMGPNGPIDPGTGQPYQGGQTSGSIGNGGGSQGPFTLGNLGQQGGFFGNIANALSSPKMQGILQQMGTPQGRLQALQQQHPAGSFWGNVTQAVTSPQAMQAYQSRVLNPAQQIGASVLGNIGGPIQQQMNQNGGFYAPPAVSMGPNGPQQTPGAPQQPMNPGQQNQTLMQSPDGQHFQYVNQEHVPHYQGLGATIHNGSSYGSQNGGF